MEGGNIVGILEVLSVSEALEANGFYHANQDVFTAIDDDSLRAFLPLSPFSSQVSVSIREGGYTGLNIAHKRTQGHGDLRSKQATSVQNLIYPLHSGQVVSVGRCPDLNSILVNHPATSLVHFMIWSVMFDPTSTPILYLRDNSLNGVFVNDHRLGRYNSVVLSEGDIIEIKCALKFCVRLYEDKTELQKLAAFYLPTSSIDSWSISNKVIGFGSFGAVFIAKRRHTAKSYAVKVIRQSASYTDKRRSKLKDEAEMLQTISHPNIIKVHKAYYFDDYIYLFEDLICGGDLFSYLAKDSHLRSIPESETIIIVYQLLLALEYLHNNLKIIHRDLKLDNVLLKAPLPCSRVILCDFGIAKPLKCLNERSNTVVGTIEYSAPEIFQRGRSEDKSKSLFMDCSSGGYDYKCDIWSLGVMIHIMLSGISPFYSNGQEKTIIHSAKLGRLSFSGLAWANVSYCAKDFVKSLIKVNPEERYSINDCLAHEWIEKHLDQLRLIYSSKILKE